MKKIELMEVLETRTSKTTEELISLVLPKLNKKYIYGLLTDETKEEKTRIYNRLKLYKSRIEKGERKEKTLSEVFGFFGYSDVTTVWDLKSDEDE